MITAIILGSFKGIIEDKGKSLILAVFRTFKLSKLIYLINPSEPAVNRFPP